ncbi:hypothetical protein ACH42_03595 [Endozoicomonas sp. (ex Bugula neritina AB1)]|nr:hypothetical protein ACH42_03595 [Endozoicomonas sp. (ex Bugula neritina AB1)]
MKGIIFTEFLEMVEDRFSDDVAEQIIEAANLPSGGSYTSLGTYDHGEILALVTQLGNVIGVNSEDLQLAFGEFLFSRFAIIHGDFMTAVPGALDFLEKVEGYIHLEVQKLYPEASPPQLTTTRLSEKQMELHYLSHRPFSLVAHGLIKGCGDHFGNTLDIQRDDLEGSGAGTEARFILTVMD